LFTLRVRVAASFDLSSSPFASSPSSPSPLPSAPIRCLTVNPLRNAAGEEGVVNEINEVVSEMNKKMFKRVWQRVKMQMCRPPTGAVSRCKLEMRLEIDSKHAKRYVSGLNLHREVDKKVHRV